MKNTSKKHQSVPNKPFNRLGKAVLDGLSTKGYCVNVQDLSHEIQKQWPQNIEEAIKRAYPRARERQADKFYVVITLRKFPHIPQTMQIITQTRYTEPEMMPDLTCYKVDMESHTLAHMWTLPDAATIDAITANPYLYMLECPQLVRYVREFRSQGYKLTKVSDVN